MCKNCQVQLLKNVAKELAGNHTEGFVQAVLDFSEFLKSYFDIQARDYIASLDKYPELKVEKIGEENPVEFQNFLEQFFLLGIQEEQEKMILDLLRSGYSETETLQLLDNIRAVEYAQNHSGELIKQINTTTQKEMSELITNGIKQSQSIGDIATQIQEKFTSYNLYRSTLIATMEVANAYSEAQKQVYEEMAGNLGVIGWKRAITQKDDNVRESHRINEDAGWIPRTQSYPGTGDIRAPYGFFCRCSDDYSITNPDTGLLYDDIVEYSDQQKDTFFENYGDSSLHIFTEKDKKSYTDNLGIISQEIAAIQGYTLGNGKIYREGFSGKPGTLFQASIPFMLGGLKKLPNYSGVTYRGIEKMGKYKNLKVGEIFKPNTFFSSSKAEDIAHEFRKGKKGTLFVINSSKGKDLNIISGIEREKEVLFTPKTLFRVEKVQEGDEYLTIYLKDL